VIGIREAVPVVAWVRIDGPAGFQKTVSGRGLQATRRLYNQPFSGRHAVQHRAGGKMADYG